MSDKRYSNIAKSIRGKLLFSSKQQREEFNYTVMNYASDRLLYRLSKSIYRNKFIVKGATIFKIWNRLAHRATKDIDLLGIGDNSISQLTSMFKIICQQPCEEDGIYFDEKSIKGEKIKPEQKYEGVRITLKYYLDTIKNSLQIDIGFGDVIIPEAKEVEFRTFFDLPAPRLRIYPRETVIAEKFQAMVFLGISNSRIKDFYDIWFLAHNFDFDGRILSQAIKATFNRRNTEISTKIPLALTDEFFQDESKQKQWFAFLNKGKLNVKPSSFEGVINDIHKLVIPPYLAIANNQEFNCIWVADQSQWLTD